jgi:hypothetical protein
LGEETDRRTQNPEMGSIITSYKPIEPTQGSFMVLPFTPENLGELILIHLKQIATLINI